VTGEALRPAITGSGDSSAPNAIVGCGWSEGKSDSSEPSPLDGDVTQESS
jgi:hypothetical protein